MHDLARVPPKQHARKQPFVCPLCIETSQVRIRHWLHVHSIRNLDAHFREVVDWSVDGEVGHDHVRAGAQEREPDVGALKQRVEKRRMIASVCVLYVGTCPGLHYFCVL